MNEFVTCGRRIYYFTLPNGTLFVEKPKCCRRLFKETRLINKAKTFSKAKTAAAAAVAWDSFMNKKTHCDEIESTSKESNIFNEIDELLKEKS